MSNLANPYLLRSGFVVEDIKSSVIHSDDSRMQESRTRAGSCKCFRCIQICKKQPQSICLREFLCRIVGFVDDVAIFPFTKGGLEFLKKAIIKKAEIGRRKFLFQYRRIEEERQ